MLHTTALRKWAIVLAMLGIFSLSAAAQSVISYTLGSVEIVRDGQTIPAEIGTPVQQNDVVRTGDNATAIVELADGAEIKLRASSQVRLDSLAEETTVRLQRGGIFSRIIESAFRGDYTVRTGTVVAGVRGTEFFTAFGRTIDDEPDLWLCVNEGVVNVEVAGSGQSTDVAEGEGINILGGSRMTDPRFFDWTTELNWNMDPDGGEVVDRTDLDQAYSDLLDQDYD